MPSWKKIIVSGSNAELNQLTATSYGGNISGSATSTGSFGAVTIDGSKNIHGNSDGIGIFTNAIDGSGITFAPDGTKSSTALTNNFGLGITHTGTNGSYSSLQINTGVGRVLWVGNDGNIEMPAPNAKISGSATSTGSFGKLLGDGSSLTGISATADVVDDTSPQLGGNLDLNSNNITGTGNIDILGTITAQNFIVSSSVTSIEYQSISGSTIFGDTEDDTHEFVGHVMMQSASFGMANHADRTNSNAANSYLFISQSVASKNGYVWQKAGNPGTNTFPFLLIDGTNNQKASIRQDGRFSTPLVYLSNDNSAKLGEIDGDAGDSSAMYINANSRALQLSSEGKKTFKINTDGTTEIGGSGAYGVTNFGDLTVGGNLNLTASAATLEVAGNISGSSTSTGSFGTLRIDGGVVDFDNANNTFIGKNSKSSAIDGADSNTVVGTNAGSALTSGDDNTLIGYNAGNDLTSGTINTLIGFTAGDNLTTESGNVFIGKNTGNTGQQLSILIGNDTGRLITSGNGTVGIGHNTLYSLSTGQFNTVVGYDSMRAEVDGDRSTAFGYQTLRSQTGTNGTVGSTAVGYKAGYNATSGIHNIFVGADTNPSSGSSNNEIVIGYGVTGLGDNQTVIGNSSQTHVVFGGDALISGSAKSTGSFGHGFIDGRLGVGTIAPTEKIHVVGNSLITGDVTIGGDLTINGDTTTISTSNILVQDAFGFFATGSAGTNVDAGIIVQSGSFIDSGSALYHDISSERWSVGKGIASTATSVPDSKWGGFVATVYTASASPVGSSPKYGVGEIHVDDDGEIYIYS